MRPKLDFCILCLSCIAKVKVAEFLPNLYIKRENSAKVVVDANIFFALMNPDSVASRIFSMVDFEFLCPLHLISELNNHIDECAKKSNLSKSEFEGRLNEVKESVLFSEFKEYKRFIRKSLDLLPDREDSPYLALALTAKAVIWSNDADLKKQSFVKVFTTKELLDVLIKDT